MKTIRWLFTYLLCSILLLELAVYALFLSGKQLYLLTVFISTASIIYIIYHLSKPFYEYREAAKSYHFYCISPDHPREDDILWRPIHKRM
ncbi:hypothetical protein [Syntrophomonas curvata]